MPKSIQISEDIVPLHEFKSNASKLLKRLHQTGRPMVVTQNGRPAAVVVTPEEFDLLTYRRRLLDSIQEGLVRAKAMVALFAETLNIPEGTLGVTFAAGIVRIVSEVVDLIEGLSTLITHIGQEDADVQIAEALAKRQSFARVIGELLNATEATAKAQILARAIAESQNVAEATPFTRALARIVGSVVEVPEAPEHTVGRFGFVNEGVAITEALATILLQFAETFVEYSEIRLRALIEPTSVRLSGLLDWSRTRLRGFVGWSKTFFRR